MKFQLDEHVAHAVAHGLRREQIEAYTPTEAELLEWCHANQRDFVTHDRHFLELHHAGAPHAGIAFCRAGTRSIGEMTESLLLIATALTADEVSGQVEFLKVDSRGSPGVRASPPPC